MSAPAVLCVSHDWRLLEVVFEDGRSTRVYGCAHCGLERFEP